MALGLEGAILAPENFYYFSDITFPDNGLLRSYTIQTHYEKWCFDVIVLADTLSTRLDTQLWPEGLTRSKYKSGDKDALTPRASQGLLLRLEKKQGMSEGKLSGLSASPGHLAPHGSPGLAFLVLLADVYTSLTASVVSPLHEDAINISAGLKRDQARLERQWQDVALLKARSQSQGQQTQSTSTLPGADRLQEPLGTQQN
ncbi:Alpha-1,2-Mannosyltransferase Alg9 [Manis pentadactyla]|nr:Alpha-1,2-Mannosyltransferase Alg9 [Manis pentadactyla]